MLRGFWLGVALLLAGCGGNEGADGPDPDAFSGAGAPATIEPICEAGRQVECPCQNGGHGVQACAVDGARWESCECDGVTPPAPPDAPEVTCASARTSLHLGAEQACPAGKMVVYYDEPCLKPYLESEVCAHNLGDDFVCCAT